MEAKQSGVVSLENLSIILKLSAEFNLFHFWTYACILQLVSTRFRKSSFSRFNQNIFKASVLM